MNSGKKWSRKYWDRRMRSGLLSNVCVKSCANSRNRKSKKSHSKHRCNRIVARTVNRQTSCSTMHLPIISQRSFRRHRWLWTRRSCLMVLSKSWPASGLSLKSWNICLWSRCRLGLARLKLLFQGLSQDCLSFGQNTTSFSPIQTSSY